MRPEKLVLAVFIDAFGWTLLKRHAFLDDYLTVKAPLDTVLGYSSTCDPTILTGKMPKEHGHFSFFYYNPPDSPFGMCRFLSLLPRCVTRRGRVRRMMSRAIRRYYGYTGYFQIYNMPFHHLPLFDYSEKRDIYQPDGINNGASTVFDHLREGRVPFYLSDWRRGEADNLERLNRVLETGTVRFAYLYLAAMDALLHARGTRAAAVSDKIAWYERRLRNVIEVAHRHYDSVCMVVFSDHGMADVTQVCDLMAPIDRLGLRFGKDYAAVYDSTMARFWFFDDAARRAITDVLKAEPRGRLLSQADLAAYGCDFPDGRYGELFFLLHPGVLLCPSFMGETPLAGMHGYAPEHPDSQAMFASNVALDPMPRRLDDLHGMMLKEVCG